VCFRVLGFKYHKYDYNQLLVVCVINMRINHYEHNKIEMSSVGSAIAMSAEGWEFGGEGVGRRV